MGGLEGRERGSQLGRRGQYRCDGKEPKLNGNLVEDARGCSGTRPIQRYEFHMLSRSMLSQRSRSASTSP